MGKTDFTHGKMRELIIRYFFPLLISNILQQFYSFVDMAIIGKGINDNAVASVGNFLSLSFLLTGFIMGITNGFAVNIAHEYGRRDYSCLKKYFTTSILMCLILSFFLSVIGVLFLKPMLNLMKTDTLLMRSCLDYGYIIFGSLLVTVFYNLISSILRVLGDSKTPLIAIGIASIINIVLDLITIYILQSGVTGPAIATVVAQFFAVLICYIRLRNYKELAVTKADFCYEKQFSLDLLKNGLPMALMNSITSIGTIFVQSCVNGFGVTYTTAYSTGNKYLNLLMLPGITLGFTASAFSGQNFGAKKYERIKDGIKISGIIGLAFVILTSPCIFIFSEHLAELIVSEADTITNASVYLKLLSVLIILLDFLFIFRSSVQGMGKPLIPMISGIIEMILRIIFIYFGLPKFGFSATIYAEGAAWIGALTLNYIAYRCYINRLYKEQEVAYD